MECLIVELFIIIKPDFDHSDGILPQYEAGAFVPFIGTSRAEYMSDMGAGKYLHLSTTHPGLIENKHQ